MRVFLGIASLAGVLAALVVPGAKDVLLLAGPCLVASLWLIWRGRSAGKPQDGATPGKSGVSPFRRRAAALPKAGPQVILDGSNVMHWQGNVPSLGPVVSALRQMEARGFTVGVIFDANAGYKLHDRYQDDHQMARQLGVPEDRVLVVPKGVSADEYILKVARRLGARVVTNDRYRDWLQAFPEAAEPGFLIRGSANDKGEVALSARDLAAGTGAAVCP